MEFNQKYQVQRPDIFVVRCVFLLACKDMVDCSFCKIAKGEEKSWKVYEDAKTYSFLDIHPASEYHTLVIPKSHYATIFETPEDELKSLVATIKKLAMVYEKKIGYQKFTGH
jgi:diadenosine tetraphosphate (Ap4A) HIT family hydrolase